MVRMDSYLLKSLTHGKNPWTRPALYSLYSKTITNCTRARQSPGVAGYPHILETEKRG